MAKKNKILIVSLIIVIILFGLLAASALMNNGAINVPSVTGPTKYWTECQVKITEKVFGKDTYIESASCEKLGKCTNIFSLFQGEGNLQMWDLEGNSKIASEDYKTELFSGSTTITIKGCSASNNLELRNYNEDGNFMDKKVI